MQEVLSREASEPAEGQEADALSRLRLSRRPPRLPFALLFSAASGLLLSLANAPASIGPIAFVALIPFLLSLRGARVRRGLLLGLVFGFSYYGAVMYWISLFGELPWAALALANGGFAMLFGALAPSLWRRRHPWRSVMGWAGLWVFIEALRGSWPFGGLTWGGLAYTQAGNRTLLPIATIVGGWGIAFVVVAVNGGLLLALDALRGRAWVRAVAAIGISAALVLSPALIGFSRPNGRPIDVAMIQDDVSDVSSVDPYLRDRVIAQRFSTRHRDFMDDPPDLIVWPENVLDQDPALDPLLAALAEDPIREVGSPTLVGAITGPQDGAQFNETLMYEGDGSIVGRHAKTRLVPFGEFVPWRSTLRRYVSQIDLVRRDLTPGTSLESISYQGPGGAVTLGSLLCFESAFPATTRSIVRDGAEFLVVSSNNSSYERTAASEQHIAMGRIRAVENGRWVAQAGISGISAFIDPTGRLYGQTELFEPTVARHTIRASTALTPYARSGDWFPWAGLAIALFAFATPRGRRVRPRTPEARDAPQRTLVVLPTYNEAATISEVLSRLMELPDAVDVLVVDDGSPDGTGELVEKAAQAGAPIRLLSRPKKSGLASAYAAGFALALQEGYDIVVEMDSDLSHQPEELSGLLHGARTADLTIGSRYVPGGSVTDWGRLRLLLSQGGNLYARVALGFPLRDATSGFRAYRSDLLAVLTQDGVHHEGYGFQVELAHRAWQLGYAIGEVPITFREREHGHSKISRRIVLEALWLVTVWGVRERFRPPGPDQGKRP